ncbi:MAG: RNA-directed DNA polymerase [Paraburkholderia sp.]|nr:MAG: RNA-directed DNA polymerase [Paraburkholderia sp.]TAM27881.1 MAG: RNA-directed DNA polymerase [Paraburkholderia sp.]
MCAQKTKVGAVRASHQRYPISQCCLYKIGSRSRLADLLYIEKVDLVTLPGERSYKVFTLPEKRDEFSGKIKKKRIVQDPKRPLRRVHDRILYLLNKIELPEYVHAAVKGRSYRSNAAAHTTAAHEVLTLDIKSFYPSVSYLLVREFFRYKMKCASDVATTLADLCTYKGALPTGSPLSPLLSYFACGDMFDELNRLAVECGLKFTCYVDDLTFSGEKIPGDLESRVKSVLRRYGHRLAVDKTIRYRPHSPKSVTGCILHNGAIHVPHSRFRKARMLAAAIATTDDPALTHKLYERLAGLLGEAAYLDGRFTSWKEDTARLLKLATQKLGAAKEAT